MKLSHANLIYTLLFTTGDSWRFSDLEQTLQIDRDSIEIALKELDEQILNHPVMLLIYNESVTLVTRPEYREFLKQVEKNETIKEFSKGALETLALIAYRGPITRSDIDYIRGVNSQFMLRNLLIRGMIEKAPKNTYRITLDALRFLGVESPEQLPQFEQFSEEIAKRSPVSDSEELENFSENSDQLPE